jgi:cysteine desulfurase
LRAAYLDHNATTPLDPRVAAAMAPWLAGRAANASSLHREGRLARNALDSARAQVAALVGAAPEQVVFTSGGTEADNLALLGVAAATTPARLLVSAVEHSAVLEPAASLARRGWEVERLPVDGQCRLDLGALEAALARGGVRLVSVMLANNETGVLQEIAAVAARVRRADALLHVDAVQAAGKLAVDMAALGCHLLTLSAHKINGPQGAGALVVDPAVMLEPLMLGGGQERGRRGGTEPVAALVGFGAAAQHAAAEQAARTAALGALRERLEGGLRRLPGCTVVAADAPRLPNTVQFALAGLDGGALQMALDRRGFAVATGSACHSGRPSHVLAAMGLPAEVAAGAVRVSFGAGNGAEQVDALLAALAVLAADPTAALRAGG